MKKRFRYILFTLFALLSFSVYGQEAEKEVTVEELAKMVKVVLDDPTGVKSAIDYFETYDTITTTSQKKAAYENYTEKLGFGDMPQKDKDLVFDILDACIRGDKGMGMDKRHSPKIEEIQKEINRYREEAYKMADKADKTLDMGLNKFMDMSYSEFAEMVNSGGAVISEREMKESYNKLHEKDGKSVPLLPTDNVTTEFESISKVIDILETTKSYSEFKRVAKILNPDVTESKIKAAWDKRGKK